MSTLLSVLSYTSRPAVHASWARESLFWRAPECWNARTNHSHLAVNPNTSALHVFCRSSRRLISSWPPRFMAPLYTKATVHRYGALMVATIPLSSPVALSLRQGQCSTIIMGPKFIWRKSTTPMLPVGPSLATLELHVGTASQNVPGLVRCLVIVTRLFTTTRQYRDQLASDIHTRSVPVLAWPGRP